MVTASNCLVKALAGGALAGLRRLQVRGLVLGVPPRCCPPCSSLVPRLITCNYVDAGFRDPLGSELFHGDEQTKPRHCNSCSQSLSLWGHRLSWGVMPVPGSFLHQRRRILLCELLILSSKSPSSTKFGFQGCV